MIYVVERDLPGITMQQLAALRRSAREVSRTLRDEGQPVAYVRSLFVPGESRCFCVFDAPSADLAREVNDRAGLPYTRILKAMELDP